MSEKTGVEKYIYGRGQTIKALSNVLGGLNGRMTLLQRSDPVCFQDDMLAKRVLYTPGKLTTPEVANLDITFAQEETPTGQINRVSFD